MGQGRRKDEKMEPEREGVAAFPKRGLGRWGRVKVRDMTGEEEEKRDRVSLKSGCKKKKWEQNGVTRGVLKWRGRVEEIKQCCHGNKWKLMHGAREGKRKGVLMKI